MVAYSIMDSKYCNGLEISGLRTDSFFKLLESRQPIGGVVYAWTSATKIILKESFKFPSSVGNI